MAIASTKCAKESKLETATRTWTAKPILGSEFTEDPPLQDVYVGLLNQRKDISKAIQSISPILPGFQHLKRCSGNKLLLAAVNSSELEVEAEESRQVEKGTALTEDKLRELLKERNFDLSLFEDHFEILKVPARVPKTKAQAARASKIWPVNFHPDPNLEKLIDGSIFTDRQLELIENYMNVAIEAARLESVGNSDCNGSAVIVDPEDGQILAIAGSRIDQHPMWHAAMLAVDLVAKLQGGGAWKLIEDSSAPSASSKETETCSRSERNIKRKYEEEAPLCFPKSLSTIRLPEKESLQSIAHQGRRNNGSSKNVDDAKNVEKSGPYLCTGYWTFLLKEPCPLCAMGLLHSRVSRIFYGVPNERTGVLGSKEILHTVPGLNHRYQVWSGILEEKCREVSKEIEHKNID